jgi:hypothetical protein
MSRAQSGSPDENPWPGWSVAKRLAIFDATNWRQTKGNAARTSSGAVYGT